ncbi:MAG TPA: pirin family protein [Stellaceae bacterium]|nr:pirin family protein [Stellaceae bacterium]
MSVLPAAEPQGEPAPAAALEMAIEPRTRDLGGGFQVRRVLPFAKRRALGPFVFFDHMGPTAFPAGAGLDVRPHPHIGLATVTYLFEGEITHRDSIGSVQVIRAGAINWMTAGRGIVHSERTPPELRPAGSRLHGVQLWVGLPLGQEEAPPDFTHYPAASLPAIEGEGRRIRVMIGALYGVRSPVKTLSELFYADVDLAAGARLEIPAEHADRGIYIVSGALALDSKSFAEHQLLVLRQGAVTTVTAEQPTRLLLLGGAKLEGERHIWWNLVSSAQARIDQAKADWKAGRFPPIPGETEFIPLPE